MQLFSGTKTNVFLAAHLTASSLQRPTVRFPLLIFRESPSPAMPKISVHKTVRIKKIHYLFMGGEKKALKDYEF